MTVDTNGLLSTPTGQKTYADPPGRSPAMKQELAMKQEMQELRQRGITKTLSKHFTSECKKVEAELAAAETALAELEARKAKASEFAPSSNQITQLDMMCMKVSEWKKQCRKNEQETIMLYARYCEKFGNSIELAKPEDLVKSSRASQASVASVPSVLANADVGTLVDAFEMAEKNSNGIPDFLRPTEASAPSSFNVQELEEILEDSSLQDAEAPLKSLAATPKTAAMDSDEDDSSIVSGLTTLNSAVTREVLHDVESKVLDFIKNETENIRKMMQEDALSKAEPSVAMSHTPSHSDSVAEHENMAKKMQEVLDKFKREEEEAKKNLSVKDTKVRRIEAGNPGEEWYEHYDETYQRNYYVEAKTKKTQWHMPQAVTDASVTEASTSENSGRSLPVSAPSSEKGLAYQDFLPDTSTRSLGASTRSLGRRSRRVDQYRAKVRRQRNRRLVACGVVLAALGAGAMYYKHTNPEQVDKVIETVAHAIGMETSPFIQTETEVKRKRGAAKKKNMETMTEKKETTQKTVPSTTPSVPGGASKQANPPTVAREVKLPAEKKEEPATPVYQEAATGKAAKTEQKKEVTSEPPPEEPVGLAPFKPESQHWILDVLVGPLAFKEVNRKCVDSERYCGDHF